MMRNLRRGGRTNGAETRARVAQIPDAINMASTAFLDVVQSRISRVVYRGAPDQSRWASPQPLAQVSSDSHTHWWSSVAAASDRIARSSQSSAVLPPIRRFFETHHDVGLFRVARCVCGVRRRHYQHRIASR